MPNGTPSIIIYPAFDIHGNNQRRAIALKKQSLFQNYKTRVCYLKLNFLHKRWSWILEFLPERQYF